MTASTLYEAVEPLALYKQLLAATLLDISADSDRFEVRCTMYRQRYTNIMTVPLGDLHGHAHPFDVSYT